MGVTGWPRSAFFLRDGMVALPDRIPELWELGGAQLTDLESRVGFTFLSLDSGAKGVDIVGNLL